MKPDLFSKTVLSVIAFCLIVISVMEVLSYCRPRNVNITGVDRRVRMPVSIDSAVTVEGTVEVEGTVAVSEIGQSVDVRIMK
jgi:hypothetical protein